MDVDVSASFDESGLSACHAGYALSGMYRGDCEELYDDCGDGEEYYDDCGDSED